MKKFLVIGLALALTGGAAYANYCARDYVPAATLLVPYAVVDLTAANVPNPAGYTTLLTVTNVSSEAQIIHITVWSALSTPVVDFDEVLTGYDVWSINFRDLLTGDFQIFDTGASLWGGSSTTKGLPVVVWGPTTNKGIVTTMPAPEDVELVNTTGCAYPYGPLPSVGSTVTSALQGDILSFAAQLNDCKDSADTNYFTNIAPWLAALTDNPVFFYVTVDAVSQCSLQFPNDPGYFTSHIPEDDNVLIGDIIYLNQAQNFSESIAAVHVEADAQGPAAFGPDPYGVHNTFYGLPGDTREPLANAFAFRYLNAGGVTTGLRVWKDVADVAYMGGNWFVLGCQPYVYYAWDENEKSKSRTGTVSGFSTIEPNSLPFETQEVPVTVGNFPGLMAGNGWMLLVFDPAVFTTHYTGEVTEAWAGVKYNLGGYSTMLDAATLANSNCFTTQTLTNLGINYDYVP